LAPFLVLIKLHNNFVSLGRAKGIFDLVVGFELNATFGDSRLGNIEKFGVGHGCLRVSLLVCGLQKLLAGERGLALVVVHVVSD
jgi:hypothetical protein